MSNTMEENIVVDAEKAKPATDVKPLRERTNRKEKIKPLQKVGFALHTFKLCRRPQVALLNSIC